MKAAARAGAGRRLGLAALLAALALLTSACAARPELKRFEYAAPKMGTEFRLVLYSATQSAADDAADAVFARVDALEAVLSDWRDESEVAVLALAAAAAAPTPWLPVSGDLWQVLAAAQAMAERSDGAFDATVGPLVQLWRRARRQGELPRADALTAALAATGHQKLRLDAAQRAVRFLVPGMRLDFGGIGKGYAADAGLALLRARGIDHALIAAAGDIAVGAPPPGSRGWRIELAGLEPDAGDRAGPQVLALAHAAVSTSGDTYRFLEIDGKRYSHIVDPKTGLGLTERRLVHVLAVDATTADALATALRVLGPARGLALIAATPGAEARIVTVDPETGAEAGACESAGFRRMMAPPRPSAGERP